MYGPDTEAVLEELKHQYCLNFNNLNITSLPAIPDGVLHLECCNTHIRILPELPESLERLECYDNPNLTHITNFSSDLRYISINNCPNITSVPELPRRLRFFFCSNTELLTLPVLPPYLLKLECNNTNISELPDKLPKDLFVLSCRNTLIRSIPRLTTEHFIRFVDASGSSYCIVPWENEDTPYSYKLKLDAWWTAKELEESKQRCILRTRLMKEELMAILWHPTRIMNYIERYGIDSVDEL
jgi:hypothetical protein